MPETPASNPCPSPFRWGVVVFPGSNCDYDTLHVLENIPGSAARFVWHRDTDLSDLNAVVLPGGFAHGDYLRTGAIARFSPVMDAVREFARSGKPVLGICNGFQVLLEAGLLPGAMRRNRNQDFVCKWVRVRVENAESPFLNRCKPGEMLRLPVAHGEGNYFVDPEALERMNQSRQVVLRYCDPAGQPTATANPNGSLENIAGITNEAGNVMGLMPHPERASDRLLGSEDGRRLFESIARSFGRMAG